MRRRWCAPKSCRPRCGSNRADRPQHGGQQPKPEPLVESTDRVAERRLRNTELRCGPGDTPLFRHSKEDKELVDVLAGHSRICLIGSCQFYTHPLGQTLIVTSGRGWVQAWGGPVEEIHPGDVVWFPPGEKHWHGATPTTAMTHIAIQEALDGKVVDWMEHVSDEQYRA